MVGELIEEVQLEAKLELRDVAYLFPRQAAVLSTEARDSGDGAPRAQDSAEEPYCVVVVSVVQEAAQNILQIDCREAKRAASLQ
jgi:hypothetical protein